jgi:glycosyltransferase involved in cell wall biosynthesis
VPGADGCPSITVVVPSRGRPALLSRAVASIFAQRYDGDVECLVVFDGGAGSLPPTEPAPRRRLRAIENGRTPGAAGARNAGVVAAHGEFVAFCDDDDEWLPGKLTAQVGALRASARALVASCGILVTRRGRTIPRLPSKETVTFSDLLRSRLAEMHTSTLIVRRDDFLGAIGPFDERIPGSFAEDYEWLLRAAQTAPLLALGEPLVRVHWHDSSFFDGRWHMMVRGLQYLLGKYPAWREEPRGLARICGQIAFASAAAGDATGGRRWGRRTLRLDCRQPRAYLAFLVSVGVLRPELLLQLLHRYGRGI